MSMMGELKFFLGIQVNQFKDGVYVHQTKYTKELMKKFKLEGCKMMNTPMHPTCILSKEDTGTKVDQKLYRGMIGSLLYLTASRPDILFSVCLCARFQSDPRESHLTIVKRIFRYLNGTTNLGFLYRKSLDYKLVGFCDADFAGDKIERKSTSGNAISIPIYCDNTAAICLSKNPILHSRAKHIEIKHHFIRDYVQKGVLDIQFIDTKHQWADIFTKPLTVERFDFIKKNLNMHFVSD